MKCKLSNVLCFGHVQWKPLLRQPFYMYNNVYDLHRVKLDHYIHYG